jgi:hypothetical protein
MVCHNLCGNLVVPVNSSMCPMELSHLGDAEEFNPMHMGLNNSTSVSTPHMWS